MAVTKIKPIKSTLSKALDYIQNPDKTDGKMLVSSFGCSYETADIEFGFTLAQAIENSDFEGLGINPLLCVNRTRKALCSKALFAPTA